jgi:radical SAM superfamily enzyme YgiQ (UPF0313 family)
MKLGLIAMSGIRAANPELTKAGLTMPGFVERSRVIASLPSLSLLTLAALTPPEVELEYREVRDLAAECGEVPAPGSFAASPGRGAASIGAGSATTVPGDYDLVAISSFSAQIGEAYRLADLYRERGVPVVMGGLHVSVLPEEARAHGAVAVVGEGEPVWPQVLADFGAGRLREEYRAPPGRGFDLAESPMPRFELLDVERYNRLTVQTSRGCPHRCDFCASSILITPGYRVKPVEKVIAEIRRIKEFWPRPFIEFADDNSFIVRTHARRLLAALCDEDVKWFTETDVSIAGEPELLESMAASGCRQVLLGLESPVAGGLDGIELRRNWKLGKLPDYETAIREIQSRGITVNGCFVLGLDGHTPEIFDQVYDFVERTGLYEVQITAMTPFPGTPLYERLRRQGRILEEGAWEKCTMFDVNFVPDGMTPDELQWGLVDLGRRLYEPDFIEARRKRFFTNLRAARTAKGRRVEEGMPDAT